MGMPPTASRSIAVTPVGVAAARIRLPMPIQKLAAKRLCIPTKSEAAYVASRARIAGFAYYRVRLDQKKGAHLPPLQTTLLAPDPKDFTSTILELDELWSFVLKKAHDSRVWIALSRQTRQVVAYAIGDRSQKTCQRLWEAIPSIYRVGHCFTDFWVVYSAVIPSEQHTAVGPRDRRNGPRGAVEQHASPTTRPFCAHDVVLFQVGGDARGLSSTLSPSLQSRPGYPSQMSHYLFLLPIYYMSRLTFFKD